MRCLICGEIHIDGECSGKEDTYANEVENPRNADSVDADSQATQAVSVPVSEEGNEGFGGASTSITEIREDGNGRHPKVETNAAGPISQFVIIEEGEVFDLIVHPYVEGATARLYHSDGAIRADGSCGQHPGTYVVAQGEEGNPNFYANRIQTSERGREVSLTRWENHRRAMREGIEKAVREKKGIPRHQMNSEVATGVISEVLTERVLDPNEPLREVTNTAKMLLEKSDAIPSGQRKSEVPEVAIQININPGLLSESFEEDD